MEVKRISASLLKTFEKCQFAFFLNYIAKIRQPANEKMIIGNVVHEALEDWANGNKDYKKSLKKAFKEYKLGEIAEDKKLAMARCIMLTEEVLNRRVNPITEYEIIQAELKFETEIGGIPSIGFMDLVSRIDKGIVEIRDWKTGTFIQTYDQVFKDFQPKIYDLAVKQMFPDDEIMVTLDYILGTPVTVIYTDEQRENNLQEIKEVVKTIKSIRKPKRRRCDWMCSAMCIGERDGKRNIRPECDKLWYKFSKDNFEIKKGDDKND